MEDPWGYGDGRGVMMKRLEVMVSSASSRFYMLREWRWVNRVMMRSNEGDDGESPMVESYRNHSEDEWKIMIKTPLLPQKICHFH
ncbi:hypothetical protein V6N13_051310 [Hibiscus sabdariffa]